MFTEVKLTEDNKIEARNDKGELCVLPHTENATTIMQLENDSEQLDKEINYLNKQITKLEKDIPRQERICRNTGIVCGGVAIASWFLPLWPISLTVTVLSAITYGGSRFLKRINIAEDKAVRTGLSAQRQTVTNCQNEIQNTIKKLREEDHAANFEAQKASRIQEIRQYSLGLESLLYDELDEVFKIGYAEAYKEIEATSRPRQFSLFRNNK